MEETCDITEETIPDTFDPRAHNGGAHAACVTPSVVPDCHMHDSACEAALASHDQDRAWVRLSHGRWDGG